MHIFSKDKLLGQVYLKGEKAGNGESTMKKVVFKRDKVN